MPVAMNSLRALLSHVSWAIQIDIECLRQLLDGTAQMSIRMYDWVRGDFVSDKNQLDRIEDLLTQLIGNVGGLRGEVSEFRAEMNAFRNNTNTRLDSLEQGQQELAGQVALLNQRMDYQLNRIAKAEEEVHILKERQ